MSKARPMTPVEAYERAQRQKLRLRARFRGKILRLHDQIRASGAISPPRWLTAEPRARWADAASDLVHAPAGEEGAIIAAYRDLAMRHGLNRIDPSSRHFARDLRQFHRNYASNFPLPEEQESKQGFRRLWRASPWAGGYQEIGYSVSCPLTGRYLMGLNFTIQPRSDSVHFIYGFVNPAARGIGFAAGLLALMRDVADGAITAHHRQHPADRPAFHAAGDPLILFEKNVIEEMTLSEILMDSAHINIDRPPTGATRLAASSMSQHERDAVWDRMGAKVIDYNYIQSSLDGVVRVAPDQQQDVIALLNRTQLAPQRRNAAEAYLGKTLGQQLPGCRNLNLCAFVGRARRSVPAAQIRLANEIFQGISVVKDTEGLADDIYFKAQMASLETNAPAGEVACRPIAPSHPGVASFAEAERHTKRLLSGLTWLDLQAGRDLTYSQWLRRQEPPRAELT